MAHQYFRIMKKPRDSWYPYKFVQVHSDDPYMAKFELQHNYREPNVGDYLIFDHAGKFMGISSPLDIDYEDVMFSYMPDINTLLDEGTIARIPAETAQADFRYGFRLAELKHKMSVCSDFVVDIALFDASTDTLDEAGKFDQVKSEMKALHADLWDEAERTKKDRNLLLYHLMAKSY